MEKDKEGREKEILNQYAQIAREIIKVERNSREDNKKEGDK